MKRFIENIDLDLAGFTAATLCFIHCSILPILLGMGLLGSMSWADSHHVELIFIVSAVIFAGGSLLYSFLTKHGNILPLAVSIGGFIMFYFGFIAHDHSHIGLTSVAGIFLAAAHLWNWNLLRQSKSITI